MKVGSLVVSRDEALMCENSCIELVATSVLHMWWYTSATQGLQMHFCCMLFVCFLLPRRPPTCLEEDNASNHGSAWLACWHPLPYLWGLSPSMLSPLGGCSLLPNIKPCPLEKCTYHYVRTW